MAAMTHDPYCENLDCDYDWCASARCALSVLEQGPMTHDVTVRWMNAQQEWRPECTCGWTGSYWSKLAEATSESNRHETTPGGTQ